jgi:hypothetical protein
MHQVLEAEVEDDAYQVLEAEVEDDAYQDEVEEPNRHDPPPDLVSVSRRK